MTLFQLKAHQTTLSSTMAKALSDLEAVAIRGMRNPASLSHPEIGRMCRLAFVAIARQAGKQ
ncbi:MAG: hypothetical protein INR70_20590 [Parafilimonas terrae]|nr:hypothetical protein [Parafilimonas terrae]